MKNYYQILGVRRDASQSDIKKAYRRLAKMFHPDMNANRTDIKKRFQEVTEAYRVLSDPKERETYDEWGHEIYISYIKKAARQNQGHTHQHGNQSHSHREQRHHAYGQYHYEEEEHCGACGHDNEEGHCGFDGHNHGDGEEHCGACEGRGPMPKQKRPSSGSIRTSVRLSYLETITGAEKTAEIRVKEKCSHCGGSGMNGALVDRRTGCSYCFGRGYIERKRQVRVFIPPRVYEGCFFPLNQILCEGEEKVKDNIVVIVFIKDDPGYTRNSCHLYSKMKVNYTDLVLGEEIEVTTVTGKQTYILPPGTPDGTRIRLEGEGLWMPPQVGNRGDLHITLEVEIPKGLTAAQQAALEAFREAMRS